jgi:hypothetical protein
MEKPPGALGKCRMQNQKPKAESGKGARSAADLAGANQIKPNQTESNQIGPNRTTTPPSKMKKDECKMRNVGAGGSRFMKSNVGNKRQ